MKYFTQYERPEKSFEINSGERLMSPAGYVAVRDQVRMFKEAGRRLMVARGYDTDNEVDFDKFHYDPTRGKNYDIVDATRDIEYFRKKISEEREKIKNGRNQPTSIVVGQVETAVQGSQATEQGASTGS